MGEVHTVDEVVSLLDYRRRVAELYAEVRGGGHDDAAAHSRFREARDDLFAYHPRSPLDEQQRSAFTGLSYYPYDPALRFLLPLEVDGARESFEVRLRDDGLLTLQRLGRVHFRSAGRMHSVSLFWLTGYGGGLFLPFRDGTNSSETYGGGRYLIDTIKGADLGQRRGSIVIDFNYAYNPSCAYDPAWDCPLAPPENWLDVPLRAGELAYKRP